jgi:hypothetical protein
MKMDSDRLNEFIVLAEKLNYSKASKMLFISQSVLSRHIMDLEEELGVRLFDRDYRNVSLTSAGKPCLKNPENCLKNTAMPCRRCGYPISTQRALSSCSFSARVATPWKAISAGPFQ